MRCYQKYTFDVGALYISKEDAKIASNLQGLTVANMGNHFNSLNEEFLGMKLNGLWRRMGNMLSVSPGNILG